MKINLDINLPGVDENEWEVVDFRRPQTDEYYFSEHAPTVQYCGSTRSSSHFILREIKRPEETNVIWHPIEKLKELDPRFDYALIVKTKGLSIQTLIFVPRECKNFQYWNYRFNSFAILRNQVQ